MTSFRDFSGREWVMTRPARWFLTYGVAGALAVVVFVLSDGPRLARIALREVCCPDRR
jgi:hypothetical protein